MVREVQGKRRVLLGRGARGDRRGDEASAVGCRDGPAGSCVPIEDVVVDNVVVDVDVVVDDVDDDDDSEEARFVERIKNSQRKRQTRKRN